MANSEFQKKSIANSTMQSKRFLNFGLLNICSIRNKSDVVFDLLNDGLDVLILTETWHGDSNDVSVRASMPPGFIFVDFLRPNDPSHGGIIIFFGHIFRHAAIELPRSKTFEALALKLTIDSANTIVFFAIYRPGSQMVSNLFFEELMSVLEHLTNLSDHLIVLGDLNIHVEKQSDLHAIHLKETFNLFKMVNIIDGPTHSLGGTLDLVVHTDNLSIINCVIYPSGIFSDHSLIKASIPIFIPRIVKSKKFVRSWNRMDKNEFIKLLKNNICNRDFDFRSADEAVDFFDRELLTIINKVAPLHEVVSRFVSAAPWFDSECSVCKRYCRRTEKMFRSNKTQINKNLYIDAMKHKNKLYAQKRRSYWMSVTSINQNNPRKIWQILGKLLYVDPPNTLSSQNTGHTSDTFLSFFNNKVANIKTSTQGFGLPNFCVRHGHLNCFSNFSNCSSSELKALIMSSPNKTSMLDILPTSILKKYVDLFLPFLTKLINLCLSNGVFPSNFKHAVIIPLLKKPGQDINSLNNYRPVSNLSFISKLIERIVAKQLLDYLKTYNLLPRNQSGYRQYHSTETALLQVTSELFKASESKQISLLVLLDMSAAFDCVNHGTLLSRLSLSYGMSGLVIQWFESYLTNRSQQVFFDNVMSNKDIVSTGVPQGSVLGPLLFMLYTADVLDIVNDYNFQAFAYADDIQIVASASTESFDNLTENLVKCLSSVDTWMAKNGIKMNKSKTKLLPIGTRQQLSQLSCRSVIVDNSVIQFEKNATVLGCTLDSNLSMDAHIKNIVASCSYQFRRIRLVRKCLNRATIVTLMHAFIHSRLDYCNGLLYGVSRKYISMLQSVQNRAAKIVVGAKKFDHVTPILRDLHWLPVQKRIIFKISILVYKCLHNMAPKYLSEKCLLNRDIPSDYDLRSANLNILRAPATKLKMGSRDFAVCGAKVWNELPSTLRQPDLSFSLFRNELKTHLFKI